MQAAQPGIAALRGKAGKCRLSGGQVVHFKRLFDLLEFPARRPASAGSGGLFGGGGGDGSFYQRRRGLERILFMATIVTGALFVTLAILNFIL